MEQRDYLLRQIELMAQALAALIRRLTGLKDEYPEEGEAMEQVTNEMLAEHLGIDLSDILAVDLENFTEWITREKGIHISNLEAFAEVLILNARERTADEEKQQLNKAALALLSYVDEQGDTFSIERQLKINKLKNDTEPSA